MKNKTSNKHRGSDFDDFLKEEGIFEEVAESSEKRIIALQLEKAMKERKLNKAEMARRMHTSRAVIDRLLNADNNSVTLATLQKAAHVLGRQIRIQFVESAA
jgi:DNA-binding Xre family transcriptional regulator